jgi:hypothetical protein
MRLTLRNLRVHQPEPTRFISATFFGSRASQLTEHAKIFIGLDPSAVAAGQYHPASLLAAGCTALVITPQSGREQNASSQSAHP